MPWRRHTPLLGRRARGNSPQKGQNCADTVEEERADVGEQRAGPLTGGLDLGPYDGDSVREARAYDSRKRADPPTPNSTTKITSWEGAR